MSYFVRDSLSAFVMIGLGNYVRMTVGSLLFLPITPIVSSRPVYNTTTTASRPSLPHIGVTSVCKLFSELIYRLASVSLLSSGTICEDDEMAVVPRSCLFILASK